MTATPQVRRRATCWSCREIKPIEGRGLCKTCYTRWWRVGFTGDAPPPRVKVDRAGRSRSGAYHSWKAMVRRCTRPDAKSYADYGGRGITVCERWLDFENFYADMGERPEGMSIDRYPDMDGNYEPGNARWATRSEQQRNQRRRGQPKRTCDICDKPHQAKGLCHSHYDQQRRAS